MKKQYFYVKALLFMTLLLYSISCTNDAEEFYTEGDEEKPKTSLSRDEFIALKIYKKGSSFISMEEAYARANKSLNTGTSFELSANSKCQGREIWIKVKPHAQMFSSYSNEASDSIPLYLFDYKNSGYMLASGDERLPEVLAYSETNQFVPGSSSPAEYYINELVSSFIEQYETEKDSLLKNVSDILGDEVLKKNTMQVAYLTSEEGNSIFYGLQYEEMVVIKIPAIEQEIKGPLITAKWGQSRPYNTQVRVFCDNNVPPTQAPAGCVAIALGQIMYYHKYPQTYPWHLYKDVNGIFDQDVSILIGDIGRAVGMNYACSGSGAQSIDALNYLRDKGYTTKEKYLEELRNFDQIKNSIDRNWPVYIDGFPDAGGAGHAWVSDGYEITSYNYAYYLYEYQGNDSSPHPSVPPAQNSAWKLIEISVPSPSHWVHFNWGWDGDNNGYYIYYSHKYGKDMKVILNIRPK